MTIWSLTTDPDYSNRIDSRQGEHCDWQLQVQTQSSGESEREECPGHCATKSTLSCQVCSAFDVRSKDGRAFSTIPHKRRHPAKLKRGAMAWTLAGGAKALKEFQYFVADL